MFFWFDRAEVRLSFITTTVRDVTRAPQVRFELETTGNGLQLFVIARTRHP